MLDIIDENGELERIKISRVDLHYLKKSMVSSNLYKDLKISNMALQYVLKETCNDGISEYTSSAHLLYIIKVVNWNQKKNRRNNVKTLFFIDKRSWLHLYKENAKKYNINLATYHTKKIRLSRVYFIKILYGYPKIYRTLKRFSLYVKN